MVRRTSAEAYQKIKDNGLLSRARFQVYDALYAAGPLTANELHLMIRRGSNTNQANVRARLFELREMGCAEELGTTVDPISGMTVILWDVTPELPRPLPKGPQKVPCPSCDGKGFQVLDGEQSELFF